MLINLEIDDHLIWNALRVALHFGSVRWIKSVIGLHAFDRLGIVPGANFQEREATIGRRFSAFLVDGARLLVEEREPYNESIPTRVLHSVTVIRGLHDLASSKHGWQLGEMLANRCDETTADVFLQMCLFGKVVYQ